MKKLIISILLFCFASNFAFADCDWKQIKPLPDGGYEYSKELHLCVGNLVQQSKIQVQQIQDLNKAISLKDLAIKASDDRATSWMLTSKDLEERLQKVDSVQKRNDWLSFGLGAATVLGAGWMASQLIHR
jgi:hypothetical protein